MLRVELIQNPVEWETYREEWNRLAGDRLTRSCEWLRSWWDAYKTEYRLSILRVAREGETVAFFPIARHQTLHHGETICFLGSGKACSDDMGILMAEDVGEEVSAVLADYFRFPSGRTVQWDHMDFDGVRTDDPWMGRFLERLLKDERITVERRPSLNCWGVSVADGWDAYLSTLSKRVRRMWNDTERYLAGESQFAVATTMDESIAFAGKIKEMHQSRWEERGIVGCFGSSNFETFLMKTIQSMWDYSESGRPGRRSPFISLITIDGVAASGMVGFIFDDTLNVYLTGMNTDFISYRPGWQTSFCGIRGAIERGCRRIDFMRGDEDYKERLGAAPSKQERWIIASPRLVSQLRNTAYYTAIGIRNWTQGWFASPPR